MLTRNKKLKDYGIPAEDIEKLNTMLKDFRQSMDTCFPVPPCQLVRKTR